VTVSRLTSVLPLAAVPKVITALEGHVIHDRALRASFAVVDAAATSPVAPVPAQSSTVAAARKLQKEIKSKSADVKPSNSSVAAMGTNNPIQRLLYTSSLDVAKRQLVILCSLC